MRGSHTLKVPNGKLLRADVEYGERINRVQLTGDFFLHPESAVLDIEGFFEELPLEFNLALAEKELGRLVKLNSAELVGFSVKDIITVVKEALK